MDGRGGSGRARWQRGAAVVEAAIALPILIAVILGALQFGLIYQAKATLNHAVLQAARAGAVANAEPEAIRGGLARGLVPLRSPDSSLESVLGTATRLEVEIAADARIRILNPTRESFDDFAEDVDGAREIPNDQLRTRSPAIGERGGLNIQDANILRLEVTYGYELEVPLINWFIARVLLATSGDSPDAFAQEQLRRTRLPIVAAATVRMHSPARLSSLVVSRGDLPSVPRTAVDAPPADVDDEHEENDTRGEGEGDNPGSAGAADHGSSLGDGFFGFGSGRASESQQADARGDDQGDEEEGDSNAGGGSSAPVGERPLCTSTPSGTTQPDEDAGLLGQVWRELKNLANTAYEFVRGFWAGIEGQIGDLVATITDPIETARGVYELAMAFVDDPVQTAATIGAALGQDLTQLIDCGAYDRGRVLGSYVSPAFMLKLATKLARFGRVGLARAAEATKHELGCASFGADTLVWSGNRSAPIQSLQPGAWVSSRNERAYRDTEQAVTRTFARTAAAYREVETEASRFVVTDEHPLWVQGRGWTAIRDIEIGAPVATADGDTLVLSNRRVDAALQVFNLSVANDESYFVGEERIWAHNATCAVRIPYHAPRSPSNFAVGASDGGPGEWRSVTRPDDEHFRYQQRITGAPREGPVLREYRVNGVDFDGYDAQRNVLLDAKHWSDRCPLGDKCRYEPVKTRFREQAIAEARSQLDATRRAGTSIEWRVMDEEMALRMSSILDEAITNGRERARISVIYTAAADIVD